MRISARHYPIAQTGIRDLLAQLRSEIAER